MNTDFPENFRHIAYDHVGSTNTMALQLAKERDPGNIWVTANVQTEGRGRRGRRWISEPGNLYASLLLKNPAGQTKIGQIPILAATALHRGIENCLSPELRSGLNIKWPNDILFKEQKIAGILVESHKLSDATYVIIGCGVNCSTHPEITDHHAASDFASESIAMETHALLVQIARAFDQRLLYWEGGRSFPGIREDWLARVSGPGEQITVRLQNQTLHGTFESIDQDGCLILRTASGKRKTIMAGDVFSGLQQ